MRLSLVDVLLFDALGAAGAVIAWGLARWLVLSPRASLALEVVGGVAAVVGLAGPLSQRFHFRPLWLSPCPRCRRIPEAYQVVEGTWPWFVIACARCGERVEVWMCRRVDPAEVSVRIASYCLRWPVFFGWWRLVRPLPDRADSEGPRSF